MIQRCCICGGIYGNKAPFHDTSETTGICGECYVPYFKKLRKELAEYQTKQQKYSGRSK